MNVKLFAALISLSIAFASLFESSLLQAQEHPALFSSSELSINGADNSYAPAIYRKDESQPLFALNGAPLFQVDGMSVPVLSAQREQVKEHTATYRLVLAQGGLEARARIELVSDSLVKISYEPLNFVSNSITEHIVDKNESYFGIWESNEHPQLDNRGTSRKFLGGLTSDYGANARAPFYFTSRRYGVYVDSTGEGEYHLGIDGQTTFTFYGTSLQYYVIHGKDYRDILHTYNQLAGPSRMPPTWALGTMWWRNDAHDGLGTLPNAQANVLRDADELEKRRIPATAMWIDRPYGTGAHGWGNLDFDASFPDPRAMAQELNSRGLKVMLWIANRCAGRLWKEGRALNFFFPGYKEKDWPAIDLRKNGASEWFAERLQILNRYGFQGFKIDRGEEGELPNSEMNYNAVAFPQVAAESLSPIYGEDYFIFSRNLNDRGRRYSAVWSGDPKATFDGLRRSVIHGQRSGLINFPMWGSDTGGYSGKANRELFIRWTQFSALTPFMETLIDQVEQSIWERFDEETFEIVRRYSELHHRLIPYTRSYLKIAERTGMPVIRPIFLEHELDSSPPDYEMQYHYGRELLVAPIVKEHAQSRLVHLPKGRWLDYYAPDVIYEGNQTIGAKAELQRIPLFIREGSIIVTGDIIKGNNSWNKDWAPQLQIDWYPSASTESRFEYFTGTATQTIQGRASSTQLEIRFGDLGTQGELIVHGRGTPSLTRSGKALVQDRDYWVRREANELRIPFSGAIDLKIVGFTPLGTQTLPGSSKLD